MCGGRNNKKGSITIFLCIVLVVIMIANGIMVDAGRIRSADALVKSATDSAALSVLADYNTALKDRYGLFGLNESDTSALCDVFNYYFLPTLTGAATQDDEIDQLLNYVEQNLFSEGNRFADANFINMYDFEQEDLDMALMYSLAEPDPLRNQIVEFSKYRVPAFYAENVINDMIEELKKVQEDKKIIGNKMALDKKIINYDKKLNEFITKRLKDTNDKYGSKARKDILKQFDDLESKTNKYQEIRDNEPEQGEDEDSEAFAAKYDSWKGKLEKAEREVEKAKDGLEEGFEGDQEALAAFNREIDALISERTILIASMKQYQKDIKGSKAEKGTTARSMFDQVEEDIKRFNSYDFNGLQTQVKGKIDSYAEAQDALTDYDMDADSIEREVADVSDEINYTDLTLSYESRKIDNRELDSQVKNSQSNAKHKAKITKGEAREIDENERELLPSARFKDVLAERSGVFNEADMQYAQNQIDALSQIEYDLDNDEEDAAAALQGLDMSTTSQNTDFFSKFNLVDTLVKQFEASMQDSYDAIMVNEYIMNMFKSQTTDVIYKVDKTKEAPDEPYIVKSRYKEAEQNLRWLPKADENKPNYFNSAEIEYVLTGNKSEAINAGAIYAEILLIRTIINVIAIVCDSESVNTIRAIAAAANAWAPVVFWVIVFAWAIAESVIEMDYLLNQGYKIPLLKSMGTPGGVGINAGNMTLSLNNFIASSNGLDQPRVRETDILLCYEDYLRLFLYITPMQTKLLRTADLIQLNMRRAGKSDFLMEETYTYLRMDVAVSMKYMFMTSALMPDAYQMSDNSRYRIHNVFYQGY